MKWGSLLGIVFVVLVMTWIEWSRLRQKKEKITFLVLTALGFVIAVLLLNNPELPGPTQLIDMIYSPLGKILEK